MASWINHPALRRSYDVAVVAVFTSLVIGSDFALAGIANFKLMDTIVFMVAFVFGLKQGAAVAVLSETVWSVVSPWGQAGAISPFLIGGELLFAFAGWGAARIWGAEKKAISPTAAFIGATLAICAFIWDVETNAATGLLAGANSFASILLYEVSGIPFMIPHELGDFLLGTLFAPATILMTSKFRKRG